MAAETRESKKDIVEGIKTFFITPDLACMPEDFLPNFFLKGFEAYYLMDDPYLDMPSKIEVLFSLFPELILFFNIDRKLHGIYWPEYIEALKRRHGARAMIGVIHSQKKDENETKALEMTYLYDIGIFCGCIPMGYRKTQNLILLMGVLRANQANGRRKYLRNICSGACCLNIEQGGARFAGSVKDVSISHFSCVFEPVDPDVKIYEKCESIQLNLAGIICSVDAVVCTKRIVEGSLLYVFVFEDSRGRCGLDPDTLSKVNAFIHARYSKNVMGLVKDGFDSKIRKRRAGSVTARPEKQTSLNLSEYPG
jgi:hypothetical protein